jgi:hypothetical protein
MEMSVNARVYAGWNICGETSKKRMIRRVDGDAEEYHGRTIYMVNHDLRH